MKDDTKSTGDYRMRYGQNWSVLQDRFLSLYIVDLYIVDLYIVEIERAAQRMNSVTEGKSEARQDKVVYQYTWRMRKKQVYWLCTWRMRRK